MQKQCAILNLKTSVQRIILSYTTENKIIIMFLFDLWIEQL